jgi:hypothetical protein
MACQSACHWPGFKHTGSYLHRQIYQHHLYTYLGYIHDKKEIFVDDNTGMAMVIDLVCTTHIRIGSIYSRGIPNVLYFQLP